MPEDNPVIASASLPAAVVRYYSDEEVQALVEGVRMATLAKNQNVTNMLTALALANGGTLQVPLGHLMNLSGMTMVARADVEHQCVEITVRREVPATQGGGE